MPLAAGHLESPTLDRVVVEIVIVVNLSVAVAGNDPLESTLGNSSVCAAIAPFDGTETVVAQEGVEKTDCCAALASVAKSGRGRIAARQQVSDGDRMLPINS